MQATDAMPDAHAPSIAPSMCDPQMHGRTGRTYSRRYLQDAAEILKAVDVHAHTEIGVMS